MHKNKIVLLEKARLKIIFEINVKFEAAQKIFQIIRSQNFFNKTLLERENKVFLQLPDG